MLRISVVIKFRALGITFGRWSDLRVIPLGVVIPVGGGSLYEYNAHGVHVLIENVRSGE